MSPLIKNKLLGLKILVILGLFTPAFSGFGLGIHYSPQIGSGIKGLKEDLIFFEIETSPNEFDTLSVSIERRSSEPLQGFGFKWWIEDLPYFDIEGSINLHAHNYSAKMIYDFIGDQKGEKYIALKTPGAGHLPADQSHIDPIYGWLIGDLTITYPFAIFFKELVPLRLYGGAGFSYSISTPIVTPEYGEEIILEYVELMIDHLENGSTNPPNESDVSRAMITEFKKQKQFHGIASHLILGARIDLIYLTFYTNAKYYIGQIPSALDQGITLEIGTGFTL